MHFDTVAAPKRGDVIRLPPNNERYALLIRERGRILENCLRVELEQQAGDAVARWVGEFRPQWSRALDSNQIGINGGYAENGRSQNDRCK